MGSWQELLALHRHVIYWYTIYYNRKTKTDICQEGQKSFTYPIKNNRVENKSTETRHRQRSGHATEVFETDPGKHGV